MSEMKFCDPKGSRPYLTASERTTFLAAARKHLLDVS